MGEFYDVFGLGNAIVDIEFKATDDEISMLNLSKGLMKLSTNEEQESLIQQLRQNRENEAAGGSTANTMVGVAKFGGNPYFVGKIGNDENGILYKKSLKENGVAYSTNSASGPTGTCCVLVTPDGERTMLTSLGVSVDIELTDIHESDILKSRLVYIEGYMWGSEKTKQAAIYVINIAKSNNIPVALSLSDPGFVNLFGSEFKEVIANSVDIVFCNEHEASIYAQVTQELIEAESNPEMSLSQLGADCDLVFMTCGSSGVHIFNKGQKGFVKAHEVSAIDTTGAGDAFAAGVIFGLVNGESPEKAATLGSHAAALVIQNFGPRLSESLIGEKDIILGR